MASLHGANLLLAAKDNALAEADAMEAKAMEDIQDAIGRIQTATMLRALHAIGAANTTLTMKGSTT